jgi:hypothetical protein
LWLLPRGLALCLALLLLLHPAGIEGMWAGGEGDSWENG